MQKTLFEEIGGYASVEALIDRFYERVLADPMLKPFFENTDVDKLLRMQTAFFSLALGGPEPKFEISLYEAHQGRGIGVEHLTRYTEHLIETLNEVGVREEQMQRIYERISTFSNDILGETSIDG